ncbi:uncharacterized protein LOC144444181 [Glandiceps talaboti]
MPSLPNQAKSTNTEDPSEKTESCSQPTVTTSVIDISSCTSDTTLPTSQPSQPDRPSKKRKSPKDMIMSPCVALFSEDEDDINSGLRQDISRIQTFLNNERLSSSRLRKQAKQ